MSRHDVPRFPPLATDEDQPVHPSACDWLIAVLAVAFFLLIQVANDPAMWN